MSYKSHHISSWNTERRQLHFSQFQQFACNTYLLVLLSWCGEVYLWSFFDASRKVSDCVVQA